MDDIEENEDPESEADVVAFSVHVDRCDQSEASMTREIVVHCVPVRHNKRRDPRIIPVCVCHLMKNEMRLFLGKDIFTWIWPLGM